MVITQDLIAADASIATMETTATKWRSLLPRHQISELSPQEWDDSDNVQNLSIWIILLLEEPCYINYMHVFISGEGLVHYCECMCMQVCMCLCVVVITIVTVCISGL